MGGIKGDYLVIRLLGRRSRGLVLVKVKVRLSPSFPPPDSRTDVMWCTTVDQESKERSMRRVRPTGIVVEQELGAESGKEAAV